MQVVHLIVDTFNTYLEWGAKFALPFAQGLTECTVSDSINKHPSRYLYIVSYREGCPSIR